MSKSRREKHNLNPISTIKGEVYTDSNFDVKKYFLECFEKSSFTFQSKEEKLKLVGSIISDNHKNYNHTTEQIVDKLMDNYSVFTNIGKYVVKIEQSLSAISTSQKSYSSLLEQLRKDVEEFSIENSNGNSKKGLLSGTIQRNRSFHEELCDEALPKADREYELYFNPPIEAEDYMGIENIEEFLNPKPKSKRWLEEIPEKLKVLVDEKNFKEVIQIIKDIRDSDLTIINYDDKLKLDDCYNYLVEKLTICVNKCTSKEDVRKYIDLMVSLNCDSLALDAFLNWISKKLKTKVSQIINTEDESLLKLAIDQKICYIMETYFKRLEEYLKAIRDYLSIDDHYSAHIVPWLKNEINTMMSQIEPMFAKLSRISEMQNILKTLSRIILDLDSKGKSPKFIFDQHMINNFKLGLESIVSHCLRNDGSPLDLKTFDVLDSQSKDIQTKVLGSMVSEIKEEDETENEPDALARQSKEQNPKIELKSCSELGNGMSKIGFLVNEFLNNFDSGITGLVYLEDFFFSKILGIDVEMFIRSRVTKAITYNYEVKSFSDSAEVLPAPNQILINYAISLLSLEKAFLRIATTNKKTVRNSLAYGDLHIISKLGGFLQFLDEIKAKYMRELFRFRIEWHFYKVFDSEQEYLKKDVSEKFSQPHGCFLALFHLMKNLSKSIQIRTDDRQITNYIIVNCLFSTFLRIMGNLKDMDKVYDTTFNLGHLGTRGLEEFIHGIYFIFYSLNYLLDFSGKAKIDVTGVEEDIQEEVESLINSLIENVCKSKNIVSDKFLKQKQSYKDQIMKYIAESKFDLIS